MFYLFIDELLLIFVSHSLRIAAANRSNRWSIHRWSTGWSQNSMHYWIFCYCLFGNFSVFLIIDDCCLLFAMIKHLSINLLINFKRFSSFYLFLIHGTFFSFSCYRFVCFFSTIYLFIYLFILWFFRHSAIASIRIERKWNWINLHD